LETTTQTASDLKIRLIDEIVYPGDRTLFYFTSKEDYMDLVVEFKANELWVDIKQYTYCEMTNGAVFILKPVVKENEDVFSM